MAAILTATCTYGSHISSDIHTSGSKIPLAATSPMAAKLAAIYTNGRDIGTTRRRHQLLGTECSQELDNQNAPAAGGKLRSILAIPPRVKFSTRRSEKEAITCLCLT
ncbi:hypothetical protein EV426DRAFT_699028 [Tirmania nivea]|nr:hypothetical protein EV426DRAFT_699028 [Tirmania nivea]